MTIRRQMILLIALPTLVMYVVILGLATYRNYHRSKAAVQQSMTQIASGYAARFDERLKEAEQIAQTTATFMQTVESLPDEKIYEQLQRNVESSPLVYGSCMAFEPGVVKPPDQLYAPYVCRGPDGFRRVNIDRSVYDWSVKDPKYTWFWRPKELGKGVWSDAYFDEGAGNILMATYSAPFQLKGKFGGVATVDIDLVRLRKTLGGEFSEDLDFVIVDAEGRFVYDPQSSRILAKTIFNVAKEQKRPELEELGRRMLEGKSGMATVSGWDSPEHQWVFYAPIPSSKWVFACRFPESRVLAQTRQQTIWMAAALGLTLLLIVGCIVLVARMVGGPIEKLKAKVAEVGRGNLDVRIDDPCRTEEMRQLTGSFNRMTSDLRVHVKKVAEEEAARARVEHDQDVTREIQRGLLPPYEPKVAGFEITGWSRAAAQPGGDYYDWQSLANGRTLVTLSDVSGRGVGSALVTAVCRAYMRATFATGQDFARLMEHLNDLLVANLPEERYVTCAAAMVDPGSNRVDLISAGHGPIFHYIVAERRLVEYPAHGVPLGVVSPVTYGPAVGIDLKSGDFLMFVTDGFAAWARSDGERFGLKRLREAVLKAADQPINEMIRAVYAEVETFAAGTAQPDDLTTVVVRRGPG